MSLSVGDLLFLLVLAGGASWFLNSLRVRELALQAARRACTRHEVQLLDQSVSGVRISLSRDRRRRWRVWRQYRFEYTVDGQERQAGELIMLGGQLQALIMAEKRPTLH